MPRYFESLVKSFLFVDFINMLCQVASALNIMAEPNRARPIYMNGLRIVVVDWIAPRDQPLNHPFSQSIKTTLGLHHSAIGSSLPCWPRLEQLGAIIIRFSLQFYLLLRCQLRIREMAVWGDRWPLLGYGSNKVWYTHLGACAGMMFSYFTIIVTDVSRCSMSNI